MRLYSTYWEEWGRRIWHHMLPKVVTMALIKESMKKKSRGEYWNPSGKRSRYRTTFQIDKEYERLFGCGSISTIEEKDELYYYRD